MLFVLMALISAALGMAAYTVLESTEDLLFGVLLGLFWVLVAIWWEVRDANY